MMQALKLTCVTATYNVLSAGNRERLVACVRSVAALKTEHEHLVYDGASTDGTAELLRELERTTPNLKIVSEPDTGIYNALNKGVRDAKGDWLYVLGSDDEIVDPETLDGLLRDEEDMTQVLVAGVDGGGTPEWAPTPRQDLWKVLLSMPYCHQGVFMRTEYVRQLGGFDERFRICADYDMLLKAHLSAARFHFTGGIVARYALTGASGMENAGENDIRTILRERLGLTEAEVTLYRDRRFPPIWLAVRYSLHRDEGVRTSARFMLRRWLHHYLFPLAKSVGLVTLVKTIQNGRREVK